MNEVDAALAEAAVLRAMTQSPRQALELVDATLRDRRQEVLASPDGHKLALFGALALQVILMMGSLPKEPKERQALTMTIMDGILAAYLIGKERADA